jgi:phosphoribosylanthranilate isomerase
MLSKKMTKRKIFRKKKMNKKLNKISRKRHYIGGLTDKETNALETIRKIRKIRINGIKAHIKEQNEIIDYIAETYSTTYNQTSPSKSESERLNTERSNAEEKLVVLNKQLKNLEGLEG